MWDPRRVFFWTIHWFESTTWCHKSFLVAISTERNGSMEEEWRLIDSLFKALVLVSDWPSGNQNWNWNSQTCLHLSMISLLKSVVVQFHVWLHAYIYIDIYYYIIYIYIVDVRKSCQRVKRKVGMAFDVFTRFLVHESCGTVLRVMGKIPHICFFGNEKCTRLGNRCSKLKISEMCYG